MTSRSKKKKWHDRYITISRRRSFQQEPQKSMGGQIHNYQKTTELPAHTKKEAISSKTQQASLWQPRTMGNVGRGLIFQRHSYHTHTIAVCSHIRNVLQSLKGWMVCSVLQRGWHVLSNITLRRLTRAHVQLRSSSRILSLNCQLNCKRAYACWRKNGNQFEHCRGNLKGMKTYLEQQ